MDDFVFFLFFFFFFCVVEFFLFLLLCKDGTDSLNNPNRCINTYIFESEYNRMTAILILGIGIIALISITLLFEYVCGVGSFENNVICILKNGFGTGFTNVNCEFDSHYTDVLSSTAPISTSHSRSRFFDFINACIIFTVLHERFVFEHLVAINENRNEIINEINEQNFLDKVYDCPLPYLAPTPPTVIVFNGFDTGLCKTGNFKRAFDNIWDANNIANTMWYVLGSGKQNASRPLIYVFNNCSGEQEAKGQGEEMFCLQNSQKLVCFIHFWFVL